MPLSLILNGQTRTFESLEESANLQQLIVALGLKGDRIAVEHNGTIAPRATWDETRVSSNDRVEVVHFVGGGTSVVQVCV